ncbi:DgyrCDS13347 [Dimorphilus gyrociliatus]|uniref:DgyrCDS13347 n=1 Tax=Dimorphilus gyrociliatus TaxID=2664684 RepID=A0A7I8WAD2_9ANNE|nr:DgyrCDS13347 [Dimorphilus gyrociliatus]
MLAADYDEFEEYRARAYSASSRRPPQPMPDELRPRTTSMPAKPLTSNRQKKLKTASRSSSGYESGISSPVDGRSRRTSDSTKESIHYVLIVGVSGVGKSSLIESFRTICGMEATENDRPIIKVTFNGKREEIIFVEEANVGEVMRSLNSSIYYYYYYFLSRSFLLTNDLVLIFHSNPEINNVYPFSS